MFGSFTMNASFSGRCEVNIGLHVVRSRADLIFVNYAFVVILAMASLKTRRKDASVGETAKWGTVAVEWGELSCWGSANLCVPNPPSRFSIRRIN